MVFANWIPPRRPGQVRGPARVRIDEQCKRLLAAILELSLLQREPPRRPQPQRRESSSSLRLDRAMQQHGLGGRHATALLSVALYGPMTVTQLAKRHRMMVKTASLIAVELEAAGLIERREDPADRRRTILAIAKGKERAVDAGLNKRAAPLQRALDRLTPRQRDGLIVGLEVLGAELSREREHGGNARPNGPTTHAAQPEPRSHTSGGRAYIRRRS